METTEIEEKYMSHHTMSTDTPQLDKEAEARFDELLDTTKDLTDDHIKAHIAMEKELSRREGVEDLKHLCYWLASLYQKNFEFFNLQPDDPEWKQEAFMHFATVQGISNRMFVNRLANTPFDVEKATKAKLLFTPPEATPQKESHAKV